MKTSLKIQLGIKDSERKEHFLLGNEKFSIQHSDANLAHVWLGLKYNA